LVLVVSVICPGAEAQEALFEGRIVEHVYKNEKLGWETAIPAGWVVGSKSEIARIEGMGKEAMEKALKQKVVPDHTPLLYLQKDQFNRFTSAAQKFDPKRDGRYKDQQEFVFKAILDAYRTEGITFDHKRGKELIGGLEFESMQVTLYTPDRKKVIAHQIVYDRLINERSLMVSVMFNNDADRASIVDALKKSKFLKKR
jgi:hypothetical protein